MSAVHQPAPHAPSTSVRARILEAARVELSEKGRAASVRDIAGRAGVTAAMINYYFGGKEALYDAVVTEAQQGLAARIAGALGGGGARDHAELAEAVALAYFDFLAEDRLLQRLFLREALERGEQVAELGRRFVSPLRQVLEAHFGARGEVLQLAVSLFGAVAGYFVYEPFLPALLGVDPLGPAALAERRAHVRALARALAELASAPSNLATSRSASRRARHTSP